MVVIGYSYFGKLCNYVFKVELVAFFGSIVNIPYLSMTIMVLVSKLQITSLRHPSLTLFVGDHSRLRRSVLLPVTPPSPHDILDSPD